MSVPVSRPTAGAAPDAGAVPAGRIGTPPHSTTAAGSATRTTTTSVVHTALTRRAPGFSTIGSDMLDHRLEFGVHGQHVGVPGPRRGPPGRQVAGREQIGVRPH